MISLDQRVRIYQACIQELKMIHDMYGHGLPITQPGVCQMLFRYGSIAVPHLLSPDMGRRSLEYFPEFASYKPLMVGWLAYWWPREDFQTRIHVLNECIVEAYNYG